MSELRRRISELLEANRADDPASRVIDGFLIVLIMANVVAVILETVPSLSARFGPQFLVFELVSVGIFTLEYLLRLWSCVEREHGRFKHPLKGRLRWVFSPLGLIDLIAIAPFYVILLLNSGALESLLILRVVRGLRLLRLFKLTRYSPALSILRAVLERQAMTLAMVGFISVIILVISSWGIYVLEKDVQPEVFPHIPAAMWWAVVTLTTVGYGDVVPVTVGGKMFAGGLSLLGIGMVAIPSGIMASGFSNEVSKRTGAYNRALKGALTDGRISAREAIELARFRQELGISDEEAHRLLQDAQRSGRTTDAKPDNCPHCGAPVH